MKAITKIGVLLALLLFCSACDWVEIQDQSTSEAPAESAEPSSSEDLEPADDETKTSFAIDFDAISEELKEQLTDPEFFGYVNDVTVIVDESQKLITFVAVVDESTDPAIALDFADTLVRRCNLEATMQDSNVQSSSNDYYGGLYDVYDFNIGVAPPNQTDNIDGYFVYQYVNRGTHQEVRANN